MGTENFVVSIYQHFYHRYPTDHELEQASDMVDRQWGLLYEQMETVRQISLGFSLPKENSNKE